MFDVGFSEMMVIAIVALVVIGPERLPKVARTAGILLGRLQRYVATVKSDISREMELAELSKVKSEFQQAASEVKQSVSDQARAIEAEVQSAAQTLQHDAAAAKPAAPDAPVPQMELGLDASPPAKPH
ncbi:MAG: Sec-independent protein translocase protein TatB [Burkholderiales bacterium]